MPLQSSILGLDIGEKRIGVAIAREDVSIPQPIKTLTNDDTFKQNLIALITENDCKTVVVGLPRGLDGQETGQTVYTRGFINDLALDIPVVWQDEAGTSVKARELLDRGGSSYNKEDIDALAACVILEDYITNLNSERGNIG
jgi:putative holliday junction resolvase